MTHVYSCRAFGKCLLAEIASRAHTAPLVLLVLAEDKERLARPAIGLTLYWNVRASCTSWSLPWTTLRLVMAG